MYSEFCPTKFAYPNPQKMADLFQVLCNVMRRAKTNRPNEFSNLKLYYGQLEPKYGFMEEPSFYVGASHVFISTHVKSVILVKIKK